MSDAPNGERVPHGAEADRRYRRVGKLVGEEWRTTDDAGLFVAGGSTCEPVWGCPDCGAIVFLRGNHDQWHTLNDTPLSSFLGGGAVG